MLTRAEALALVREYVQNESLIRHMLSRGSRHALYCRKVRRVMPNCGD